MNVDVAPTHTREECVAWLDTNHNYGAMFVRRHSPSPVVFLDHDPELYMKKRREEQRCNVSYIVHRSPCCAMWSDWLGAGLDS